MQSQTILNIHWISNLGATTTILREHESKCTGNSNTQRVLGTQKPKKREKLGKKEKENFLLLLFFLEKKTKKLCPWRLDIVQHFKIHFSTTLLTFFRYWVVFLISSQSETMGFFKEVRWWHASVRRAAQGSSGARRDAQEENDQRISNCLSPLLSVPPMFREPRFWDPGDLVRAPKLLIRLWWWFCKQNPFCSTLKQEKITCGAHFLS